MKWKELLKIAESNGWVLDRHGKEHDIYRHPEKNYKIQIERHWNQEVKKGIYNKLKKQIGA